MASCQTYPLWGDKELIPPSHLPILLHPPHLPGLGGCDRCLHLYVDPRLDLVGASCIHGAVRHSGGSHPRRTTKGKDVDVNVCAGGKHFCCRMFDEAGTWPSDPKLRTKLHIPCSLVLLTASLPHVAFFPRCWWSLPLSGSRPFPL